MELGVQKRRSVRQLADRKRSVYFEPDTDDELDVEVHYDEFPLQRSAQHSQQAQTRPRKKAKVDRRAQPLTRSKAKSRAVGGKKTRSTKKSSAKTLGKPIKPKAVEKFEYTGPSDGNRPAWTSLPLEILRDIFIFASQPMLEHTTEAIANSTWLMRAARTCRAFAVPALEAYYHSPYFHTSSQPYHLLALSQIPPEKTYINYRVKVKRLEIDVSCLSVIAAGRPLFALVQELPLIQHLEVVRSVDLPPYRSLHPSRWTYPPNLFECLESSRHRLKSWRWSRDMIPATNLDDLYGWMTQIHTGLAFQSLERLVICGFDATNSAEPVAKQEDSATQLPSLASATLTLPRLKNLTFISCDLIMEDFLLRIPQNLERLELSNCLEVTSDMLRTYLISGGSQLRELELNHNASLNLAFLPELKSLCPRLEVLKMDLTYYSERYNYNDAWALYDELLSVREVPSFPSTLRHLELVHLQKWSAEAARNLFSSLIDSAEALPALRHLVLQAHIDIPWRDRAGFRDQWIERLHRVFLRPRTKPNPHLGSLKQYRLWTESQTNGTHISRKPLASEQRSVDKRPSTNEGLPVWRVLSHVQVTPVKPSADVVLHLEPEVLESTRPRRSTRVAESQASIAANVASVSPVMEDSSSESDSDSDEHEDCGSHPEGYIQGLCEVVDIRIDNQRPREKQWTEGEFLDSEASGDEDWHSGADLSDQDGYAW